MERGIAACIGGVGLLGLFILDSELGALSAAFLRIERLEYQPEWTET